MTDSTGTPEDENQRFYAVRYSPRADREIAEASARLAEITGSDEIALEWFGGIKASALTLATNPKRLPVDANSSRMLGEVMLGLLFQRNPSSSPAYHLCYTVEEAGDDGPRVTVIPVRHASRKPMTRAEAKDIRAGQ